MRSTGLLILTLLLAGCAEPEGTGDERTTEAWVDRLASPLAAARAEAVDALVARGSGAAEILVPRLAEDEPELFEGIAAVARRSPAFGEPLRAALSGEDAKLAGRAALLLLDAPPGTTEGDAVTAGVRKALADTAPWIRLLACEVLWIRMRDGEAIAPVLAALLTAGDPQWLEGAAILLERLGPDARPAIGALEEVVAAEESPKGPFEVSGARRALRHVRDPGIRGVLLDPRGDPLPNVAVIGVVRAEGILFDRCATDELGRFVFHVPPETVVDLEFEGEPAERNAPWLDLEGIVVGVEAPADDIVIETRRQKRDGTLKVRVLGADGEPLAPTLVTVTGPCLRNAARKTTGPDGRATFSKLPGRAGLTVHAERGPETIAHSAWANPAPAHVVPDGREVELRFRDGVLVRGVVLDPDGLPRSGFWVRLFDRGAVVGSGRSDAQGRFRVTGLPGVKHVLAANTSDTTTPLSAEIEDFVPDREAEAIVRLEPFEWDGLWERIVLRKRR